MTDIIFSNIEVVHEDRHDTYKITNPDSGCMVAIIIPTAGSEHWGNHLDSFIILEDTIKVEHGSDCACTYTLVSPPPVNLHELVTGTRGFQRVILPIRDAAILKATSGGGDPEKSYRTCSLVYTLIVSFRGGLGLELPAQEAMPKAEIEATGLGDEMRLRLKDFH